jgi:glycerol-3-phosphate dehydrogenase
MNDLSLINSEIDKILERLAEDDRVSIIEFHLRYFAIEKARRDLNESFAGILRLIREDKGGTF